MAFSTAEYLHEVARCILVEQYIGQRFPDRTSTKMLQVAAKYLIGDHKYLFLQYYRILRCEEEMKHLFSLLRSNHQTLHLVLDEIRTNLDKAFPCKQTALYAQHGQAHSLSYTASFVDIFTETREKFLTSHHAIAECAILFDEYARAVLNGNSSHGTSLCVSPDRLAAHMDTLLRKRVKFGDEVSQSVLDNAITVFQFIEDKDVFQTYHATTLARRLIDGTHVSHDMELHMITKLEEFCGHDYGSNLRRMITDLTISEELTKQFQKLMHQGRVSGAVALQAMVLNSQTWPTSLQCSDRTLVPAAVQPMCTAFTEFFLKRHTGRKLTWLWNLSRGELQTNYFDKKYILSASFLQMSILLQYNDQDSFGLNELIAATGIAESNLKPLLTGRTKVGTDQRWLRLLRAEFKLHFTKDSCQSPDIR